MSGANERDEGEEVFVQRIKAIMDAGNASLDGHVRSRLTQARYAALEQAHARPALWTRQWAPAAGLAAAAVAAAVILWPGARPGSDMTAAVVEESGLNDLEIVLAEAYLELMEELDFY